MKAITNRRSLSIIQLGLFLLIFSILSGSSTKASTESSTAVMPVDKCFVGDSQTQTEGQMLPLDDAADKSRIEMEPWMLSRHMAHVNEQVVEENQTQDLLSFDYTYHYPGCLGYAGAMGGYQSFATGCDSQSCLSVPPPNPCSYEYPHTGYNFVVSQIEGGTVPSSTSIQVDDEPVQGSDIGRLYPDSEFWYYLVRVDYDAISTAGDYYVDVTNDDTQGPLSCTPWVDSPTVSVRFMLYIRPLPPSKYAADQGSRLGCASDSFQGGGCGSCGGGDLPWPSVVNPAVYQPLSVPGGLAGPAGSMMYNGTNGCYSSRVEVFETCDWAEATYYDPPKFNYYVRIKDRCGKCYVFNMGTKPNDPQGYGQYIAYLEDYATAYLTFYNNGATFWVIDYVDGYREAYDLGAPSEDDGFVVASGPFWYRDSMNNNQTWISYDVENGGQVYDEVETPDGSTWRYHHASGDNKITKVEQVATGASYAEIDYTDDKPSQVRVKNSSGVTESQTDYTYDNGKIKTVTRGDRKVEYTFTESNQVITVKDIDTSDAAMTETVYDYRQPDPNPNEGDTVSTLTTTITRKDTATVNPAPDQVTYYCFYQSSGKKTYLRRVIDPEGKTTTYDVNTSTGRINWVEDPTGLRTTYAYNSKGVVTTTTYSKTGMTTYHKHNVYYQDTSGNPTVWLKTHESMHPADDSARGNFTLYVRNTASLWQLDAVKLDPVGAREPTQQQWDAIAPSKTYQYYGTGDPDGLPGQLKKEITPDIDGSEDYEVTYKYTETAGKRRESPTQTIYRYWNSSTSAYENKTSTASYDDMGRVLTATDANSRTIQYEYDALGRQRKTIYGTGVESESHYTCCTLEWTKDEDGRKASYTYDDMNRVLKVWTEIDGQSESASLVEYSYDAFGNQHSVKTRSDTSTTRETIYTYDNSSRVTKIVYPTDGGGNRLLDDEYFQYDDVGNLVARLVGVVDGSGNITSGSVTAYAYDDLHRLTDAKYNYSASTWPLASISISSPDVHYTYYGGTGLVHTMDDDSGTSSYDYNGIGKLTSYTPPQPASRTITYTYNNLGQKLSVANGSFVTNYEYFANGWLKNVKKGTNTVASYTYDPVGVSTRVDFGNSTWQTFGYDTDPRYRLDDIHYAYDCGSGIADQGGLIFTRDNAGNPLTWGDADGLYGRVYDYDKNSRLKSANYPGTGLANFVYDWVGNRTSLPGSVYNAADQLTAMTGHTYQYDGTGNMTYDNSTQYTYTPSNLLATAGSSSMVWDAVGNRIRFTSSTDQSNPYTFVYDPTAEIPAVIEEVHNGVSVYYVRKPGGALICRIQGESIQYYHFDDLGSTLFLTGSDGSITDKYTYDAWGNRTSHTGSTSQPYQYVGHLGYYTHYQDGNLPLLQLGVRLYDPNIGRFTQQDPVSDGINWYVYVSGNTLVAIDPWGLCTLVFSGTKLKLFQDDGKLLKMVDAYSGAPGTGPADVERPIGPIPEGEYSVNPEEASRNTSDFWDRLTRNTFSEDPEAWGKMRVPIHTPDLADFKKNYPKRDGTKFTIHGGDNIGSHGCIDLGHNEESFIKAIKKHCSDKTKLVVDYSGWKGTVPSPEKKWPR